MPNRSDLLRAFTPAAAAALVFLLAFGLIGGWWLAGRMLVPLGQIGDAARTVAGGSLSHRVRLPGPKDEFREVADAFDTMLERLEDHVQQQQRFAANASHELRTPLAISQTLLEVARADPSQDVGELLDRLQLVNARAIDVTESLLLLSRADSRSIDADPVDLSLLAEEAAEQLLPLAERRGISLEVTGDPAWTSGSPALLSRMVANLVQNAIVHNRGEVGTVQVRTGTGPWGSTIRVENTGEVIPPELSRTLTEPFRRGVDRLSTTGDDHAGAGLGLAIVHSIVDAHEGSLTVEPRPGGGLIVAARFRSL